MISDVSTQAYKTSIAVTVQFEPMATYSGYLYCASLPHNTPLTSLDQIRSAGVAVVYYVGASNGTVLIPNLQEITYIQNVLNFANTLIQA